MKKLAFIYIILAGIAWGTSGIFVTLLSPYGFTSPQLTSIRATVSLVAIGCYILIKEKNAFKATPKELFLFLGSGITLFGTSTCYYVSMQATSISTAVVLMYTAPVIVMIYSVAFLGEKLTKLKTISVLLMVIGCGLVSGIIGGLKFDLIGILIGMLSGICYSAYNILTKIQMEKGIRSSTASFYNFLITSVISLIISDPIKLGANASTEPSVTIPLMIALGIVTYVIPYVLYTNAMKYLPAGTASALGIVEPMAATIFSIIIFHEKLSLPSAIGIILILAAVLLLSKTEKN